MQPSPRTPHSAGFPTRLSRRGFIGGVAATGVLAACGSSDGASPSVLPDVATAVDPADTYTLVQRFPSNVVVPGRVRLPITLSTGAAEFIQDGPAELEAQVVDLDGVPVGGPFRAVRRDAAPAPYYDFRTDVADPGFYSLVVEGGPPSGAAFQITAAEDVDVPSPGMTLPGFDTPTVEDPQDYASLCTRLPEPCPFHDLSLAEALELGRPVAYYVGTPAFCSTGTCAPALESLIEVHDEFGDTFVFVHVEIYTDDAATEVAPAVSALAMTYEPALFVTDAAGVIVERLDAVWDRSELEEVLRRAVGA